MEKNTPEENIDSLYSAPESDIQNVQADRMGYFGMLVRFTLVYLLSAIVVGIIVNVTGLKQSSVFQIVILYLAILFASTSFAKKNQRSLTKRERVKATVGFSVVNISFQLLATLLVLTGLSTTINLKVVLLILIIPLVIHAPFIYFCLWSNMRRMTKRGEIPAST